MELDQFVEEDIRTFLDQYLLESKGSTTSKGPERDGTVTEDEVELYMPMEDYPKELAAAIDDHDRSRATHVLEQLKRDMGRYPPDSQEWIERKKLFEPLYDQFKRAFSTMTPDELTLTEELRSMGAVPTKPERAERTDTRAASAPPKAKPDQPPAEPKPAPPERETKGTGREEADGQRPQGLTEEQERALVADVAEVETLAKEARYAAAMRAYQEVKRRLSPEQMTPEQRERIMRRMRLLHDRLVQRVHAPDRKGGHEKGDLRRRFMEHRQATEDATRTGNLVEAIYNYHAMLLLHAGLPDEERHEAKHLLPELYRQIRARLGAERKPEGKDPEAKGQGKASADGPRQAARSTAKQATLEGEERRLQGSP